MRGVVVGKGEK
uniref:Uncharacterized protein n=1 Tax=Rhizophora mucronata TaxID=61149 RepID=A0A2P2QAJ0_RHIMU